MCMIMLLSSLEYVVIRDGFLKAVNKPSKVLEVCFNMKSLVLVESVFLCRKQPGEF